MKREILQRLSRLSTHQLWATEKLRNPDGIVQQLEEDKVELRKRLEQLEPKIDRLQARLNKLEGTEKGAFGGICNLSRCTSGLAATWYNFGNRNYYCKDCAKELNSDPYNKRDALRLFGHELLIEGKQEI